MPLMPASRLTKLVLIGVVASAAFLFSHDRTNAQTTTTNLGFSIRNDGTILKGGVSFFPFGFYHDSDFQNRYGASMANDFTKMCQAGFNIVQSVVTGSNGLQNTQAARDVAKNCPTGMYIIASYYAPAYQTWLNGLKNDPTVMAYNTNDDFNVPYNDPVTDPTEAKAKSDLVKNYANSIGYQTWTYGSGGGYPYNRNVGTLGYRTSSQIPYIFGDYQNVNDFYGTQTYPIGNTDGAFAGAPLEENINYLSESKKQLPDNKPLLANLQSFNWGGTGADKRYPNAVETRSFVWASIVTRVDGILAYTYWHNNGDLSNQTATWNEWKALRQDINGEFLKAILDGKHTYINTSPAVSEQGKGKIHAATFEYTSPTDNKPYVYVVAMNTSSTASLTTTNQIRLPSLMSNTSYAIVPQFPNNSRYGNTMTVQDNSGVLYLNGTIAASGVQVYKITINGTVAQSPTPTVTVASTPVPLPTLAPGSIDPCRSDFNQDGFIDLSDYSMLINDFLKADTSFADTDINQDAVVDLTDYSQFLNGFFKVCSYQCI